MEPDGDARRELKRLYRLTGRVEEDPADAVEFGSVVYVHDHIVGSGFQVDAELEQAALKLLERTDISDNNRYAIGSAMARVYEKRADLDVAFELMQRSQAIAAGLHPYDPDAFKSLVDNISSVFSEVLLEKLAGCGVPGRRPVFIVGMPRSGTSLVEQILAGHPNVFAAGELSYIAESALAEGDGSPYPEYVAGFKKTD